MRILLMTNDIWPLPVGGIGVHTFYLTEALVRGGHDVLIINAPFRGAGMVTAIAMGGRTTGSVRTLGSVNGRSPETTAEQVRELALNPARRFRPDLIHAQDVGPALAVHLLRRDLDIPLAYTAHCVESSRRLGNASGEDRLIDDIRRDTLTLSDMAIAVSDALRAELSDRFPTLARKIETVRLPIARSHVQALAERGRETPEAQEVMRWVGGRPYVTYAGRLSPEKGPHRVLDIVAAMRRDDEPSLCFVIVGDGKERASLQARIDELSLSDHVRLVGRQPHQVTLGLMADAAVHVVPSVYETAGIAGIEALACDRRIVASALDGIVEHLSSGGGVDLLPLDATAEEWATRIRSAATAGPTVRTWPEELLWTEPWDDLIAGYQRLVGGAL